MAKADMELVREFAESRSEPAFAELVARHVSLVHSAAWRQVGDTHLAEEVTQAVFIVLARKAASLGPDTILSAWLYRTARYVSADALKIRRRRERREQEACMRATLNEQETSAWEQLSPTLDEVMASLGETDRAALVLRFLENKTASEIATALKLSEGAAQKRIARALEKLRKIFSKRGVKLSSAVIAGAVSVNSVQAAPVGLAGTVTATAAKGTAISATMTTLVNGVARTMNWLKIKLAMGIGAAALLAGGVVTVAVSRTIGASHAGAFQVEGFITRTRSGATPEHFCDFSAIISGEKSLIRVQYFNGESFVCGTDGRDSYLLNEMKPARAKDPNAMEFGYISSGPFPSKALAPVQLVWLAYASAAELDRSAGQWPLEDAKAANVSNEVRRFTQPPGLPEEVKWWAPGMEIVGGRTNFLVEYPEGFLSKTFKAQAPTNIDGRPVPTAWDCTWYRPRNHDLAGSLEIAQWLRNSGKPARARDDVGAGETLECRVTNIVASSYQGDFLPQLGTNVSLIDYRFEKELGEGIGIPRRMVRDPNGRVIPDPTFRWVWPGRDDPNLLRQVEARQKARQSQGR